MTLTFSRARLVTAALVLAALAAAAPQTASAAPPTPNSNQLIDVSATPRTASTSNEYRGSPSVSADGRYVAFASNAQDLLAPVVPSSEVPEQIYVRDTVLGTTKLVSQYGGSIGNARSESPVLSDDGTLVTYISYATNLTPSPTLPRQVFVWSAVSGLNSLVSTGYEAGSRGVEGGVDAVDMSATGAAIVYSTRATDVLPGDPYVIPRDRTYRIDGTTGETTLVAYDPVLSASSPTVSDDGRFVAFLSSDQHTPVDPHGVTQAYLRDMVTNTTRLASAPTAGIAAGDGPTHQAVVSGNGAAVAFATTAGNLVPGTADGESHVFVRNISAGTTTVDGLDASGAPAAADHPSLSHDGRVIAYSMWNASTGGVAQIVARNRISGAVTIASFNTDHLVRGNGSSLRPNVSSGGRFVSWTSLASNLTADVYPAGGLHEPWHTLLRNLGPSFG